MKKNNMFFTILGFSAVIHGLILFGTAKNGFHTPFSVSEKQFVSVVRIIKTNIAPQHSVPNKPPEENQVKKPIEPLPAPKPVPEEDSTEPLPVSDLIQEAAYTENTFTENVENNEGVQYSTEPANEGGTITGNEYEELLAYIKEFISKNLVYPPIARRRNIQGSVGVSFEIEADGGLASVTVNNSSGSSILDNAAVSLIKKIRTLENIAIQKKLALNVNIDYKLTE
jgi:protein TonB